MKLSAQMTLYASIVFALLCLGYAAYGWIQLGAMPAGQERDDAHGFVYFWGFLGLIGAGSAWISWKMVRAAER
jgi:hypothetical protein